MKYFNVKETLKPSMLHPLEELIVTLVEWMDNKAMRYFQNFGKLFQHGSTFATPPVSFETFGCRWLKS